MKVASLIVVWAIGLLTGFFLWPLVMERDPGLDTPILAPVAQTWVDLPPFGAHLIPCVECGSTYRFFYSAPAPWKAALSHDPTATEIMRDMMNSEPDGDAPKDPQNGPEQPEEPELDL